MIKEAFEYLFTIGRNSVQPVWLTHPGASGKHESLLYVPGQELQAFKPEPPPWNFAVAGLEDLVTLTCKGPCPSIWIGDQEIIGVLDMDSRRDRVRMPLSLTKAFATLSALKVSYDQAGLIRLLRDQLGDCVQQLSPLLAALRQIKFSKTESGHAVMSQGKASLGRAIESELAGAGAIPEIIVCQPEIYLEFSCDVPIDLSLEVRPAEGDFLLSVRGDALHEAKRLALHEAKNLIRNMSPDTVTADLTKLPIYFGSPNLA